MTEPVEDGGLHPAWEIVWMVCPSTISHSHHTVFNLVCVSKAMQAAVLAHCYGAVPVVYNDTVAGTSDCSVVMLPAAIRDSYWGAKLQRCKQFAAWIAQRGFLMQSLDMDIRHFRSDISRAAAAALAASLDQAAAATAPRGLQLQSFTTTAFAEELLAHIPGSSLTALEISTRGFKNEEERTNVTTALAGLKHLKILKLVHPHHGNDEYLPSNFATFLQLTKLCMRVTSLAAMQQLLPASLLELQLCLDHYGFQRADEQLQLGHLTALTSLRFKNEVGRRSEVYEARFVLRAGDALPPNLVVLELRHCESAVPLIAVRSSLKELVMQYVFWDEGHNHHVLNPAAAITPAVAAALQALAPTLQHLELTSNGMPAALVQQFRELQALTCLKLASTDSYRASPVWIVPEELGAALLQLAALQQLELNGVYVLAEQFVEQHAQIAEEEEAGMGGMQPLVQAVVQLPNLRRFQYIGPPLLDAAAIAQLEAATQLTQLEIVGKLPYC